MTNEKIGKYTEDTLDKKFADHENFKQQRSHLIHTAMPANTVGINGEVRLVFDGTNAKLIAKVNGVWKSTTIS